MDKGTAMDQQREEEEGARLRGRLVVLSGPSCAGKSPLAKALRRFFPELTTKLKPVVLYNARAPRPGEVDGADYHFRARAEIESMRGREGMLVLDVRGDLQALDLTELGEMLDGGDDVFFEGNPFVGGALVEEAAKTGALCLSMFVTPLAGEELRYLASSPGTELEKLVTDVMRRKLLRRTRRQKGEMSLKDLEEIERRAESAFRELKEGSRFTHVIPNHDGEDSENWDAFYHPLGDARKTMLAVAALLAGEEAPAWVEDWSAGFPGGEAS